MMKCTALTTVTVLLLCSLAAPGYAADLTTDEALQGFDEQPIDEALQGFDSDTGTSSDMDAALAGFDDDNTVQNNTEAHSASLPLSGAITLSSSWNTAHDAPATGETDYRGLSRLRTRLNLEHDGELDSGWRSHISVNGYYDLAYAINGRNDYTDEVLEEYESELELGEAWVQGSLNAQTDLKLGRQIVVWGKSDNIRVTDLVNPLDSREPGMVDIEDLRLPLTMAKLDYYVGDWGFSAMAIPEIRFNKTPPFGSDFYPSPSPMPSEEIPGKTEYALAANGTFSGWDLSLYLGQFYDDNPHTVITPHGPELQHSRFDMAGLAMNVAIDNWLLKTELAQLNGLKFSGTTSSYHRTDALLGVEYSGLRDTTLSLEVANRHIHDYDSALIASGIEEDEWQTALRYQGDFLHARLHLLGVISLFGEGLDEGGFGRYSAAYDLADAMTLTGGLVRYESGEKVPFGSYGDNDRLFIELKYSF